MFVIENNTLIKKKERLGKQHYANHTIYNNKVKPVKVFRQLIKVTAF